MRTFYCENCGERTPHTYIGKEHEFDEDGALIRTMGAVFTLGMSELFCVKNKFYQCKYCGKIHIENV